jgi:branched-chain amino acid aminotransferase
MSGNDTVFGNGPATLTGYRRRPRQRGVPFIHDCVWVDGELVPQDEALAFSKLPALHYGPGVHEAIRCYMTARGPAIFRLEAHLQRFLHRARRQGVPDLHHTLAQLRRAAHVTVQVNNYSSCYLRPVLFFLETQRPHVAVAAWAWPGSPAGAVDTGEGVHLLLAAQGATEHEQDQETSLQESLAMGLRSAARKRGFAEAIVLDDVGRVAGCSAEGLFVVDDGVVYTPRLAQSPGITRDTVMTLTTDLGYELVEKTLSRAELYAADEIFVAGIAATVLPVRSLGERPVGTGRPGPVSRAVQQAYVNTVQGKGARSREWLEYVMMEPLF